MLLAIILVLLVVAFVFVRKQYSYWEHNGVPHVKPSIPFGNLESVAKKQRSFGTAIYDIYTETKEPFIGIYLFFRPALLIRDAELVKSILVTEFHEHFSNRGVYCDPKSDPMSANLFALPGKEWKNLRTRLTPAFTSGKLKGMFPIIHAVGEELVKHMKPLAERQEDFEIRDLGGRYVADSLASVAFGLEGVSTLRDPNHEFRMNARKLNDNSSVIGIFRRTAVFVCPK